jgi:Flp pilus assembly protein TadD
LLHLLEKAQALYHAGDLHEARRIGLEILKANQINGEAWHLLGVIAYKESRFVEAEELILRALSSARSNPYYHNSLGSVLRAQGKFEPATASYRQSLRINPSLHAARLGFGICLRASGDLSAATAQLQRLVSLCPRDVDARVELAITLHSSGQLDNALSHFRAALKLQPGHPVAQRGLAETLLLRGHFHEGWREYLGSLTSVRLPTNEPLGSAFKGKRVVVYGSEGVGDEIMAAGCIPDLLSHAKECTLYTDQRLAPLFARSFPSVHCIGVEKRAGEEIMVGLTSADEIQLLAPMLLPYLRPNPDEHPARHTYLVPDAGALAGWRDRYRALGPGLMVGLSWRGGVDPQSGASRSIPLQSWEPVLRVPGVHFVSLQYGDTRAEIEATREKTGARILYWGDANPLADLDGFAAQVAALDLVISVDNSTVHMAGALGVPTWTLLPFAPSWRWLLGREDSPWYPTAVRLLRQAKPGDWSPVFQQVRTGLSERLNSTPR